MRRRRPVLDYLAYVAVRTVVCLGQMMSVEQSYAFARGLAALLYRVDKRHRKVGMENLRLAFGDRYSEAERDAIVRGVYRHFCMMLMEILHIPRKLHADRRGGGTSGSSATGRSSTGCSTAARWSWSRATTATGRWPATSSASSASRPIRWRGRSTTRTSSGSSGGSASGRARS